MGDISLIEWGVYGFIAYSSLLMLIISTIKDVPTTKSLSIARSIYLIPGMICAGILSYSGININLPTTMTNSTTISNVTMERFTENVSQSQFIQLVDPAWMIVHVMIFLVLLFYVIMQMLVLLTKTDG